MHIGYFCNWQNRGTLEILFTMRKTDFFALTDWNLFSLLFAYNVLHGIQWLAIIKNRICQQFFVTENSLPSNIHHGRNVINVSMEIGLFLIWSKDPQTIEHWLRSFSLFLFSLYAALFKTSKTCKMICCPCECLCGNWMSDSLHLCCYISYL